MMRSSSAALRGASRAVRFASSAARTASSNDVGAVLGFWGP